MVKAAIEREQELNYSCVALVSDRLTKHINLGCKN